VLAPEVDDSRSQGGYWVMGLHTRHRMDDLFAWALLFAPLVIGYGGGYI
jgi:hypothetical protein